VPPSGARRIDDFSLPDLTGHLHTLAQWSGHKGVVLIFLGTDCPVSNGYAPEMQRLADRFGPLGIVTLGVHGDPSVTQESAVEHAKTYGLRFPVLLDPEQVLARATGVRIMPEVVVALPSGEVLYRGRIDDRFAPGGKRRDEPRVRELHDALQAVCDGKRPAVTESKAFGCPLPKPRVAADGK